MKRVNTLAPSINSEHNLVSRGAVCWAANDSSGAETAPRTLKARATPAPRISGMNMRSAITAVAFNLLSDVGG